MSEDDYQQKVRAVHRRCFWVTALVVGLFTVAGTVIGILIELHEPAEATPVLLGLLIGAAIGSCIAMPIVPIRFNRKIERLKRDHRAK